MARCGRRSALEVHPVRKSGGNDLDNAEVLCPQCRDAASARSGDRPQAFQPFTREKALVRAGWQCECRGTGGCH